jgi:hypothetical protein
LEIAPVRVSFQVSSFGPVMFDFERIAHPAFVNVGFDEYMRFEDAIANLETLDALETTFGKQLGDQITYHGGNAPADSDAEMLAALVWFLAACRHDLETRDTTEDIERLLGAAPIERERPPIFTRLEVIALMATAGDDLTTWANGYGLRHIAVENVLAR